MALTGTARKYGAEQIAKERLKYVGLFETLVKETENTSETAEGASLINLTGAKAAGWTNGRVVWFTALNSGITNVFTNRPYFIVGEVTNGFEIAEEPGGTAIKFAGKALKHEAATKFSLLVETTGGASQERQATTFAGIADGAEDSGTRKIKVQAGKTVTHAGWWSVKKPSEESGGKGEHAENLMAVAKLTEPESFGAEGEYNLTADTLTAPFEIA
jgi:hypothetical protein